ncbi:hypothetical protein VIGAN_07153000 [Vigna angularis var. angularis]|uniref:Uncharacterized protein n=1 Tax=Vigna angularis var. angularis TaxID=157739 RepID=A0A0S3SIM8_PHAAN|nr:hypothetical protein VIGAN_07153000 [Vigna angularis var. angularis]
MFYNPKQNSAEDNHLIHKHLNPQHPKTQPIICYQNQITKETQEKALKQRKCHHATNSCFFLFFLSSQQIFFLSSLSHNL